MGFFIAFFIVSVSCALTTSRTLIAYTDYSVLIKSIVYIVTFVIWLFPMIIFKLQAMENIRGNLVGNISKYGYFFYGFAFILMILLVIRDFLWMGAMFTPLKQYFADPDNPIILNYANIISLIIAFVLSMYSVYQAEKLPQVLSYEVVDDRIKENITIAVISDMHITRSQSIDKMNIIVKYINGLNADAILMVGDIADDKYNNIGQQIKILKKIKACKGIFYVLGNHECYYNGVEWEAEFANLGWRVLHNSGVNIGNSGLYVAGVPDISSFSINVKQAIRQADSNDYKLLMSHNPMTAVYAENAKVDMQVSGHTHGGQIFPFNLLAKYGNKGFVAGKYVLNKMLLLVSRGFGYWGPQMRLGAPSDIIIIKFKHKD